MRYLLDTHALIWYIENNQKLSVKVAKILDNPDNLLYISIISAWEITIKLCLNKINISFNLDELFNSLKRKKITILPIKQKYLKENLKLKMIHGDPFDRLIIATAISEKLKIITSDRNIHLYNVDTIW